MIMRLDDGGPQRMRGVRAAGMARTIPWVVVPVVLCWLGPAQARTWTMADGRRTLQANFVSLDKGVVSLQTPDNETRKLPLEELSELDRDVATRLAATTAKSVEVEVEGVGLDPAQALENAFTQAVHAAVGARVKSKTVVESDQLKEDTVLVFSDGFISRYDRLAGRQDAGLCYQRIKAVVQKRDVTDTSTAEAAARDASNLYAEAYTKVQRHRVAMAILQDAMDGFSAELLDVSMLGRDTTEVIPDDAQHVQLRCTIKVKVSMDRYRSLYDQMVGALTALARANGRFTTQTRPMKAADPEAAPIVTMLEKQFLASTKTAQVDYGNLFTLAKATPAASPPDAEAAGRRSTGSTLFYLCQPAAGAVLSPKSCTWRWFEIDGYPRLPAQRIATVVRYSDEGGQTVFEESVNFGGTAPGLSASGGGNKLRTIVVSPFFLSHVSQDYTIPDIPHAREVTISKALRMPLTALSRVREERVLAAGELLERQERFPEDAGATPRSGLVVKTGKGQTVRFDANGDVVEVRVKAAENAVAFSIVAKGFDGDQRRLAEWLASGPFKQFAEQIVRTVARSSGSWQGEWEPYRTAEDGTVTVEMVMKRR
jgi:hypothetical protein